MTWVSLPDCTSCSSIFSRVQSYEKFWKQAKDTTGKDMDVHPIFAKIPV